MQTREMLDLKRGTKLKIRVGSAVREVTLQERPRLECIGKPGPHRVRLQVLDLAKMPETTDECWSEMVALDHGAFYEVGGDKVLEVSHD